MSDDKPLGAGGPWKDPADEQKRADETTQTIARAMAEIAVRDLSTFYIDPCRGDDAMGAPGDRTRPFKTMPSLTHLSGGLHYNVEVIPCAGPFPCSCGQRSARNLPTVVTSSVAGLVDITADAQRVCIEILRADLARSERYALRDADERERLRAHIRAINQRLDLPPDAGVKEAMRVIFDSERYALRDAEERDRLRAEVERLSGVLKQAQDMGPAVAAEAIGQHAKRQGLEAENERLRAQAVQRTSERDAARALLEQEQVQCREADRRCEDARHALHAVYETLSIPAQSTTSEAIAHATSLSKRAGEQRQLREAINERIGIPKDSTTSEQLSAIVALHEKYEDVTGALHSLMDRDKESIRGSERYALRDAEECKALKEENRRFLGKIEQQDARARAATQAIIRSVGADGPMDLEEAVERIVRAYEGKPRAYVGQTRDERDAALAEVKRLNERISSATQWIARITGAKDPLNLEDAVELLAGHPKHPQGILGAVRDELSTALAEVARLEGELWLAESVRDESVREHDEARQEVVSARRAVLLRNRLGGMLALRTEDEIFVHVEDMAVQNTELLRQRETWSVAVKNAIGLREEQQALDAQREEYEEANREVDRLTELAARDRAAWAASSDNAINLGAQLRQAEDDLKATRALLSKAKAERDHATRRTRQDCANIAQETAHEWDGRSLRGERDNDYETVRWARSCADVARKIETKIRALLEAK